MNVWFPDYYTEAHRERHRKLALVAEFAKLGVECTLSLRKDTDLVFCGSIWLADRVHQHGKLPPLVHYSWDIYPFQLVESNRTLWLRYFQHLRKAQLVLVPSRCSIARVEEFARCPAEVCLSSANFWDAPTKDGGYVVDVMRKHQDRNMHIVQEVCMKAGIPLRSTRAQATWEEFKAIVAGARLLVSPNYEASTGGLTLIEGYRLGKPVLLSNSPRNGAVDYFGDRGTYFQWDDSRDLLAKLRSTCTVASDHKAWAESNYSDLAFARRLKNAFDGVLAGGSAGSGDGLGGG